MITNYFLFSMFAVILIIAFSIFVDFTEITSFITQSRVYNIIKFIILLIRYYILLVFGVLLYLILNNYFVSKLIDKVQPLYNDYKNGRYKCSITIDGTEYTVTINSFRSILLIIYLTRPHPPPGRPGLKPTAHRPLQSAEAGGVRAVKLIQHSIMWYYFLLKAYIKVNLFFINYVMSEKYPRPWPLRIPGPPLKKGFFRGERDCGQTLNPCYTISYS